MDLSRVSFYVIGSLDPLKFSISSIVALNPAYFCVRQKFCNSKPLIEREVVFFKFISENKHRLHFNSPNYSDLILGQIKKVIHEEGPISRSLLAKRVLQAWGITRLGTKLDQRFTDLFAKLEPQTTETEGTVFFWSEGVEPRQYIMFRVSADESQRRMAEDLPPEE